MSDNRTTDELAKVLWDYNTMKQRVRVSDCILALGSHDIRVAHRAADLFLQGFAPWIIFSGNLGRLTEDMWDQPEAEIFAEEAIRMGVPRDKILIENRSTNTGDNIRLTKELLAGKGLSVETLILVQKPYMQRRAYATCKKVWPDKDVIVTAPQLSFEEYPNEIIKKNDVISIMVGDTQRIKVYADRGFQIPQEIPADVWAAYEELVRRGFTSHLIE
jgi:uncharacterized SAM-binding protein YcdF (DUF218 family)